MKVAVPLRPPGQPVTRFGGFLRRYSVVLDVACLAALPVTAVAAPGLLGLSALSAAAMALKDLFGTLLTRAEAIGRDELAGEADRHFTVVSVVFLSFSAVQLVHHGWRGWVALLPTLFVDRHSTGIVTRLARRMKTPGELP